MGVCTESDGNGRLSVICMTRPLPLPEGASISNSGKPDGGLVVYRALPFRNGPFFLNDDMLGKACSALSEAIFVNQKASCWTKRKGDRYTALLSPVFMGT